MGVFSLHFDGLIIIQTAIHFSLLEEEEGKIEVKAGEAQDNAVTAVYPRESLNISPEVIQEKGI